MPDGFGGNVFNLPTNGNSEAVIDVTGVGTYQLCISTGPNKPTGVLTWFTAPPAPGAYQAATAKPLDAPTTPTNYTEHNLASPLGPDRCYVITIPQGATRLKIVLTDYVAGSLYVNGQAATVVSPPTSPPPSPPVSPPSPPPSPPSPPVMP